jgi:serine/threonine protein kinase
MPVDSAWLQQQFKDLKDLELIGQGGQKQVYSARHAQDGDVVLKLVHPSEDPELVRREIVAVSRVESPRVPRILEQGQLQTQFGVFVWIREQRVMGETVRHTLANGPFPGREVLRLGAHMLEALARAETVNIVHRDVKPDNIMRDVEGNYWLLDFGIARHLTLASMTPTAAPFGRGTLGYASPEQCRNIKSDIDSRADLFALGITLYECGTGANPFLVPPLANVFEKLRRVETISLPPLMVGITQPEQLRDLIQAMTQKRRDLRPRTAQSALEWIAEIEALQTPR